MNSEGLRNFTQDNAIKLEVISKLPNKRKIFKDIIEEATKDASNIAVFENNNPFDAKNIWEHTMRRAYLMFKAFTGVDVYELHQIDQANTSKLKMIENLGMIDVLILASTI
jgi:hypothetical protein